MSTAPTAMSFNVFLDRVIDDGIQACRESYKNDTQKRDGAVAGFEACRARTITELRALLADAQHASLAAFRSDFSDYWYHRCYAAEVEWVCNVVSAALDNAGEPPIVPPTARGWTKAIEILGVATFNAHAVN